MLALLSLVVAATCQDPLQAQLPKEDLGVRAFLEQYPDYNGQGVRVAILDTGIDPGHPFLQRNPDGSRKIVDWYDATTDGRLQIQHHARPDGTQLIGLSGRRLELGRHYQPDTEYGLIRLDQAWLPDDLEGRIQAERRSAWQKEKLRFEDDAAAGAVGNAEQNLAAAELAHRMQSFEDDGPVWDVLVFERDGERLLVIDNDEDGDLDEEPALRGFRASGDWATLGDEALMNYAVEFESQDRLVLYFDAHGHGTHVAGIVGAYEGEGGRMNGIAPGVELVSIKIGDGKFGGSTSGFAISKALDYAVESGCQIVNMSFGGPSFAADGNEPDGWAVEEATRRGLCVVTSAGNEGPALSTVGAPATTDAAFSIAAAIWPDTARANYASLDPAPPILFDFSSRGPLPNGALGIDYAAPGAALSPLPSWGLAKGENWNGTSMAAPQMAGCLALLHSAARQEGLGRTPARLDRALRLSARPLLSHDWVEQGHGFITMLDALTALRSLQEAGHEVQGYEVVARNAFGDGAGIYLRDLASKQPTEVAVSITPTFGDETPNAVRADFLRTFAPVADASWVQVPDLIYTNSLGRTLSVRVDPSELEPGLHSARVLLYDVDAPRELGAELVIPVTVIVAHETHASNEHRWASSFELEPGELQRSFVRVPWGANYAELSVTQLGGGRNEIRAGAGSVSGTRYSGDRQARGRYFLEHGQTYTTRVPVEAGTVFEYVMASRWATNTEAQFLLEIQFVGVMPQEQELRIPAGQDLGFVAWQSFLTDEDVSVSAKVEGYAVPVHVPLEIRPDPIRADLGLGRRMFLGTRSWSVDVPDEGCDLVLRMPESIQTTELREDLMLVVTDAKGQVIHRHIAYEIDTELGHFDGGSYQFELIYPGLGAAMLETAYAGAELRFLTGGASCSVSNDLNASLRGEGAARLRIPFGGSRLAIVTAPELEPLADGAYWFGSVRANHGSDARGMAELRIERPILQAKPGAEGEAILAAGEDRQQEEAEDSEAQQAEQAYRDATATSGTPEGACRRVLAARAWQQAAPLNPEAELAIYESLVDGGLPARARELARGFLTRFPGEIETFLSAAKRWNP